MLLLKNLRYLIFKETVLMENQINLKDCYEMYFGTSNQIDGEGMTIFFN